MFAGYRICNSGENGWPIIKNRREAPFRSGLPNQLQPNPDLHWNRQAQVRSRLEYNLEERDFIPLSPCHAPAISMELLRSAAEISRVGCVMLIRPERVVRIQPRSQWQTLQGVWAVTGAGVAAEVPLPQSLTCLLKPCLPTPVIGAVQGGAYHGRWHGRSGAGGRKPVWGLRLPTQPEQSLNWVHHCKVTQASLSYPSPRPNLPPHLPPTLPPPKTASILPSCHTLPPLMPVCPGQHKPSCSWHRSGTAEPEHALAQSPSKKPQRCFMAHWWHSEASRRDWGVGRGVGWLWTWSRHTMI